MKNYWQEISLVVATLLLAAVILAYAAPPACPPGKLDKLSESERRIRIEQWDVAIESLPDAEKPGRRQKLRNDTGLSATELDDCRKPLKRPKRPFEAQP